MPRHILVPTDLSEKSNIAFSRAAYLAKKWEADCTLLHVIEEDNPDELSSKHIENVCSYLKKYLSRQPQETKMFPDIQVKKGSIHDVINDAAEEKQSALIVMGGHHKNFLFDVFKGTTIERVLQKSNVPVLMAARPTENDYDSVLFGVDVDTGSEQAIETAFSFGLLGKVSMTVVHAFHDLAKLQMKYANVDREGIMRHSYDFHMGLADDVYGFLSKTPLGDCNYSLVMEDEDPARLIVKIAVDLDVDLVVIGTRNLTAIRKVVLGSVAEGVLRQAHSDVLIVPPKNKDN